MTTTPDTDKYMSAPLPQETDAFISLRQSIEERLLKRLSFFEEVFSAYSDAQKRWSDFTKETIITGIAESFTILGLTEEHLPDFFIYRDMDVDHINAPSSEMWVDGDPEQGVTWGMNFDKIYHEISEHLKAYEGREVMIRHIRAPLIEMVANKSHRIMDIYFNPERAEEIRKAEALTGVTFLVPGEHAAQQFGIRYRELWDERYESAVLQ